ncbi:MAG: TolC family protein [Bryobacterales bacterium]|nr:TolC family protein [Bryobacterales bacterium]
MHSNIFAIGLLCSVCLEAQYATFPQGNYFRETFGNKITRVELRSPVRLTDSVIGDKLELSLRSYLELVMANNTDVQIQRLNVETAANAITRAFAPFDPLATASFTNTRSKTPANGVLDGAATVSTLNQPANFRYQQTLETGTQYNVAFFGQKQTTNSGFQNFNPALNSNLSFGFVQPLLRDRGGLVNRLPITLAKSRLRQSQYQLRDQIMRLLADAENVYWDVVFARENLAVAESSLELASASLKRSQRELELGALSPLDIFQPQQVYASAEIRVSQARFALSQREDALRKQIAADLDPGIRRLPLVLTEAVLPPTDTGAIDAEMKVERALQMRPDLKAAIQELDSDDIGIKVIRNVLKPALNLTGTYTSQGRGGIFNQRGNLANSFGQSTPVISRIPGGFGDALDQVFGFGFPIYQFGITLRLPVRDRAASANLSDAIINKRRDSLAVRNIEQTTRLDVLNAVNNVESSKASVKLAIVARDFAQKRLDAEQKKYELGTSQIFFVLQAQSDLIQAQSELVRESVNYRRNNLNLIRRTGELLDERGVYID